MSPEAISEVIRERVESGAVAALAAGVFDPADGPRVAAWGDSGPGQLPLSTASVFEIGSVTKIFTAILLTAMAESGEVALDDTVDECLPKGVHAPRWRGRSIRLVDLAEHRSGLPRLPTNLRPADAANPLADYTIEQLYEFLRSYTLPRPAGAQYEYSNLGFGLLGHALASRAGRELPELLADRIFVPLGLGHTSASSAASAGRALALPHDEFGNFTPLWEPGIMLGCGGLLSTVGDMLAFATANLEPARTPLARAMAIAREARYSRADGMRVALAWHVRRPVDRDVVWHSGETSGSRAFIGLDPARRRAVVILSNSAGTINDLALHLLDDRIDLAPPRADIRLDPETLTQYVGDYDLTDALKITITLSPHGLEAAATGIGRAALHPRSPNEFFIEPINGHIRFHRDPAGAIRSLTFDYPGHHLSGTKTT